MEDYRGVWCILYSKSCVSFDAAYSAWFCSLWWSSKYILAYGCPIIWYSACSGALVNQILVQKTLACSASGDPRQDYWLLRLTAAYGGSAEEYGAVRLHWWRTGLVRRSVWCRCCLVPVSVGGRTSHWMVLSSFSWILIESTLSSKITFWKMKNVGLNLVTIHWCFQWGDGLLTGWFSTPFLVFPWVLIESKLL